MPRNADGTWRNANSPSTVSPAVLRARWIDSEILHLKQLGLSYDAIADEITLVGRGQAKPMVVIPPGVTFPPDYKISPQGCHERFKRAISRAPSLELEEMRRLDNARSEDMLMNLQPAIRKGNPRAIEVAVKVLEHQEKINAYAAPRPKTPQEEQDDGISIAAIRRIIGGDDDELIIAPSNLPRLLTREGDLPNSNGSIATGVGAPVGDKSAPRADATKLPAVIEWRHIEIARDILEQEEEIRTYLYFI
jgi:hypothetical protein